MKLRASDRMIAADKTPKARETPKRSENIPGTRWARKNRSAGKRKKRSSEKNIASGAEKIPTKKWASGQAAQNKTKRVKSGRGSNSGVATRTRFVIGSEYSGEFRMFFRKTVAQFQTQLFPAFALAIFIAFFFLTVWGENGVLRLVELRRIKAGIESGNTDVLRENLLFVQQIEKLKDAPYVEQKARSNLGMVRDNETVFVISE